MLFSGTITVFPLFKAFSISFFAVLSIDNVFKIALFSSERATILIPLSLDSLMMETEETPFVFVASPTTYPSRYDPINPLAIIKFFMLALFLTISSVFWGLFSS